MSCNLRSSTAARSLSRPLQAAIIAAVLACTLPGTGHAQNPPPVATAVQQALGAPVLSGSGKFTYWGFHVYDAWLWVGARGLDPKILDQPFALVLRYARDFSGKDIADRSAEEIAKLGIGSAAQQAAWAAWMQANIPNVKEGDTLTGLYQPDGGLTLLLNGKRVAANEDPSFARAFFSIWLDERTTGPALRAALLQRARQP